MSSLSPLFLYLAIAAVLAWSLRSRRMTGLRRFVDRRANAGVEHLGLAKRVAALGDARQQPKGAAQTHHRTTIGLRAVSATVCTAVLWVTFPGSDSDAGGMQMMGPDLNSPALFATLLVLSVPYLIFIWRYDVILSGTSLSVPTFWFTHKKVDLTELDMIEDDGAYCCRLYFRDGRRVEVLKYLTGRSDLLRVLKRHEERNS